MPERFKVAVTDSEYESHEIERRVLAKVNAELEVFQCRTEDEVMEYCSDADGLLNSYVPITRRVIGSLNAKVVTRYGIGVDNIDIAAATERGILVTNVIYDITDVADHTLSLVLSLARKIPRIYNTTKRGEWDWREFQPIARLKGRKVGIIGFGRIGRKVAQRLKGFEVELCAYDPYVSRAVFEEHEIEKAELETLLEESDIVTVHVALTDETRHLIGEKELRRMRGEALLINVSRGGIVDEKALYRSLKEGWIGGAGLDVLENELLVKGNPLVSLSNVIITPHIAWYSIDSLAEIQEKAAEQVAAALCGQIPPFLMNKEVLNRSK